MIEVFWRSSKGMLAAQRESGQLALRNLIGCLQPSQPFPIQVEMKGIAKGGLSKRRTSCSETTHWSLRSGSATKGTLCPTLSLWYHKKWLQLGTQPRRPFHSTTPFRTYSEPLLSTNSTIYSLSSGSNTRSAIAVIRISGPEASQALMALTDNRPLPQARRATGRKIFDPVSKEQLDFGLVIWFPAPNSFTGEDVVELHLHGGRAVVRDVLLALGKVRGLSEARPGEFTRRAFENNKLDLMEVEGLADLLHAETEAQRRQALKQMRGDISALYSSWRSELLSCTAHIEAVIDFGEDDEITNDVARAVLPRVNSLMESISKHLNDGGRGERLRDGAHIAVVGPPNAGKSSLINLLAKRQASIVSPIPGTTRDVVEVVLNFGGYPLVIGDTAGIRVSNDMIEQEGIKRAKERFNSADLKLCVLDSTSLPHIDAPIQELVDKDTLMVLNKVDRLEGKEVDTAPLGSNKWWKVSCATLQGFPEFLSGLEEEVKRCFEVNSMELPIITRARHREHLAKCVESLQGFQAMFSVDTALAAEELRSAIKSLSRITGKTDVEEILDIIFSDFCIGK